MTRTGSLVRTIAAVVAAGGCAALAAVACGGAPQTPPLHPAGTPLDDGTGLLARASVKLMTSTDEGGFEPDPRGGSGYAGGYDEWYGGFTYGGFGGDLYGGGYGGSIYAGYQAYPSYNSQPRSLDYAVTGVDGAGAIEGVITWPRAPKRPATVPGPAGCGELANTSVVLGAGDTVEGAIVYLEKLTSGRAFHTYYNTGRPITIGGSLEVRDCALTPRVQVHSPAPGQIVASNAGDVPITLRAERIGADARAEARLDVGGTRALPVGDAGVMRIGDTDGALLPAWVVSARHPYYAMTDARGRFRLDDVVPGEYTLVVWHPPAVTGVVDGVVQFGEPVVVTKKVVVKKLAASKVAIELP